MGLGLLNETLVARTEKRGKVDYITWYTTVYVDLFKWRLVEDGHVHKLCLIGNVELFEDDGDLPWVRTGS